jgi:hypothetical protein
MPSSTEPSSGLSIRLNAIDRMQPTPDLPLLFEVQYQTDVESGKRVGGEASTGEQARRQLPEQRAEFARRFESYIMECVVEGQSAGR